MKGKLPNITELDRCPSCGGDEYYFIEKPIGKIIMRYKFDGSEADNSEMYSNISTKPLKFVYCSLCGVKIARNNKQ